MTLAEIFYDVHGKHQAELLEALVPADSSPEAQAQARLSFHQVATLLKDQVPLVTLSNFSEELLPFYEQPDNQIEVLLETLDNTDYLSRGFVATLLGKSTRPDARAALYRLIASDPSALVRQHAAAALGVHATQADRTFLLGLLAASAPSAPERPVPWERLREVVLTGGPMDLRSGAADALGNAQATEAVEPLLALIEDPSLLCQCAAIRALGNIGDHQALAPLEALQATLGEPTNRRTEALHKTLTRALTQLKETPVS